MTSVLLEAGNDIITQAAEIKAREASKNFQKDVEMMDL